jgi:hypothetical protein
MNRDATAAKIEWQVDRGSVDTPLPNIAAQGENSRGKQIAWGILLAAIVLTVLEGAIRKWLIGSPFQIESYLAYFSKDVVFALLLLLPVRANSSAPLEYFGRWLIPGCFLVLCGALASSTQEISFSGALLTLRAAVFLPVVAFLVVPRMQGISLRSVALFIGLMTILNFALGIVQNELPARHILNRYVVDTADITTTPTGVRATGTFSYISGMAIMSVVGVWAGIVQLSLGRNISQKIFGWAALASGVGCGLASVSRGPIVMSAVMISVWLMIYGMKIVNDSRSTLAGIVLLVLVSYIGLTATFIDLGQGLLLRADTAGDTIQERSVGQFFDALTAVEMAPFGNGLGAEQVGRKAYSTGELARTIFESPLSRLVLETGVFGLLGFLLICSGALLALQIAKLQVATSGEKAALLITQLFLFWMLAGSVVFNHVASAFAWILFAAVMASLPIDNAANDEKMTSQAS